MKTRKDCAGVGVLGNADPLFAISHGIHWVDDPAGAPGGGAGVVDPSAGAPAAVAPVGAGGEDAGVAGVPATPAAARAIQDAIERRNRDAFLTRSILARMGASRDQLTISRTNDPNNPYRVEGLDELFSGGGVPDDKKTNAQLTAKLGSITKQNDALKRHVHRLSVQEPIRAACAAEHAIDDDNGTYADIVGQLEGQFNVTFADDAAGGMIVEAWVKDQNGNPRFRADGSEFTARDLVAEFLNKKPKYRSATFRAGPGAGGRIGAPGNGAIVGSPAAAVMSSGNATREHARRAMERMTGIKIPADVA